MIEETYACAYKEVIEVLKYTKIEDVNKIPKDMILLLKTNMKKDYDFSINPNKSLEEQNLSKEARAIIANIFKDYWATDYQKQQIEKKEKYDLQQIEKEKLEKYNPDNIFKNETKPKVIEPETTSNTVNENITQNTELTEIKENIFQKIMRKIKMFFKKK